jgi:hypothetical protein
MFDLLTALAKFEPANDRESDAAFFRTHVPWVAPEAYLNIIYKPADKNVLADVAAHIRIPDPWVQFLARHNGARLFSARLYVMGVVAGGTLLNRRDHWSLPPINIEQDNVIAKPLDLDRYLIIASYGFDGSLVCMDRNDLGVYVFHRREGKPYASWKSAELWISSEVQRFSGLFDSKGKLLVDSSQTLPSARMM